MTLVEILEEYKIDFLLNLKADRSLLSPTDDIRLRAVMTKNETLTDEQNKSESSHKVGEISPCGGEGYIAV